jgi:hypothetical protein
MSDRFDLEQRIMDCWNLTSELKVLNEALLDKNMSKDELSNILIGLTSLYNIKFDNMFWLFEQLVHAQQFDIKVPETNPVDYVYSDSNITRVDVIDNLGRSYTNYKANRVDIAVQDEGRTLKVFVTEND